MSSNSDLKTSNYKFLSLNSEQIIKPVMYIRNFKKKVAKITITFYFYFVVEPSFHSKVIIDIN